MWRSSSSRTPFVGGENGYIPRHALSLRHARAALRLWTRNQAWLAGRFGHAPGGRGHPGAGSADRAPASAAAPVPADPFLPWPSGVILLLTSTRPLARVPPTLKWLDQPCPKGGRQPRPFAARGSRDAAGDSFLWGRGKAMGRKPFFGLLGVCLAGLAVCGCQPQQKVDSSTRQSPQLTSTTATNPSFGAFGNSNSSGSYPSSGYAGSTTNGGYPSSGYAGSTTSGGYPSSGYAGSTTNGGYPSSGYAGSTTSGGYPSSGYAGSTTSGGYPSSGYAGSTTSGGYPSSGYAGSTTSGGYRMSTPSSGFSGSTLSGSSTPSIGTRTGSNLDSSSSTTPTPSVNSITPTTGSAGPNNTNLPALPSSTAPTSGTSLSSRSSVVSPSSLPLLPTAVDTQSSAGKSGVPPLSTNSSSAGGSSTLQLPDLPRLTPPVPPQADRTIGPIEDDSCRGTCSFGYLKNSLFPVGGNQDVPSDGSGPKSLSIGSTKRDGLSKRGRLSFSLTESPRNISRDQAVGPSSFISPLSTKFLVSSCPAWCSIGTRLS